MSTRTNRPVRNLAAWGYESDASGDRIEIDVWTVNAVEAGDENPIEKARRAFGGRIDEVIAVAGDVAKVDYTGAAGIGYARISTGEAVAQQAFAGAARSAGGTRTEAGTFREGAEPAVIGPDLDAVIEHGRTEVLPVARREFQEIAARVVRESSRDEDEEAVESAPFDGFRNVIRMFTRNTVFRYEVDGGVLERL